MHRERQSHLELPLVRGFHLGRHSGCEYLYSIQFGRQRSLLLGDPVQSGADSLVAAELLIAKAAKYCLRKCSNGALFARIELIHDDSDSVLEAL